MATIARFRARHERALSGLFAQVLGLCARAGLISLGVLALDGTKLAARPSVRSSEHQAVQDAYRERMRRRAEMEANLNRSPR